jgi:Tfp pilus assembly protein PilO
MLANRTSRWSIGTAVVCIALLAASWFLLVTPRRAEATEVRAQVVQADDQATLLRSRIAKLKVEFAGLPKRLEELEAIKKQLPPDADVPMLVRDFQRYAAKAGVSLDSIAPGGPVVVSADGAVATGAVAGPGTLVRVPMILTINGDYFEAALFLKHLQTGLKRSFLITDLSLAPGEVTTSTSTPTGPAPTSTAVPTATATPAPTATAAVAEQNLDFVSMTITGAVFVLLDGSSTLADVTAAAQAAAGGTPATAATTAP